MSLVVKVLVTIAEPVFESAGSKIIFENHAGVTIAAKEGLAMVIRGLAAIDEHCFVSAGFENRAKSEKCPSACGRVLTLFPGRSG